MKFLQHYDYRSDRFPLLHKFFQHLKIKIDRQYRNLKATLWVPIFMVCDILKPTRVIAWSYSAVINDAFSKIGAAVIRSSSSTQRLSTHYRIIGRAFCTSSVIITTGPITGYPIATGTILAFQYIIRIRWCQPRARVISLNEKNNKPVDCINNLQKMEELNMQHYCLSPLPIPSAAQLLAVPQLQVP